MERVFETQTIFNFNKKDWEDFFWIDGRIVDEDTYYNDLGKETIKINEMIDEMIDRNNNSEINDNEFSDSEDIELDNLINTYVDKINHVGNCPCCTKTVLTDFVDEFLDFALK